jgi:hypothetical protein
VVEKQVARLTTRLGDQQAAVTGGTEQSAIFAAVSRIVVGLNRVAGAKAEGSSRAQHTREAPRHFNQPAGITGAVFSDSGLLAAALGDGSIHLIGPNGSVEPKLLGISKWGSTYLRKRIIQGARAALPSLAGTAAPLGARFRGLLARAHGNTGVVALASQLARVARALLCHETAFAAGGLATAQTGSACSDSPTLRAVGSAGGGSEMA